MVSQNRHVESSPIERIYTHGYLERNASSSSSSASPPSRSTSPLPDSAASSAVSVPPVSPELCLGPLLSRTSPNTALHRQHSSSPVSRPPPGGLRHAIVAMPIIDDIDVASKLEETRCFNNKIFVAGTFIFHDERSADIRVPIEWPNAEGRPDINPARTFDEALQTVGYQRHLFHLFEVYVYKLDGHTYVQTLVARTPTELELYLRLLGPKCVSQVRTTPQGPARRIGGA